MPSTELQTDRRREKVARLAWIVLGYSPFGCDATLLPSERANIDQHTLASDETRAPARAPNTATRPDAERAPTSAAAEVALHAPNWRDQCELSSIHPKTASLWTRKAPVTYFSSPEIEDVADERHCTPLIAVLQADSLVFGKVLAVFEQPAWGTRDPPHWSICRSSGVRDHLYVFGTGVRDACGSVAYQTDLATPRYSNQFDALHGNASSRLLAVFEDHTKRAPSCAAAPAAFTLSEHAREDSVELWSRTRYSRKANARVSSSRVGTVASGTRGCPFFSSPDHVLGDEPADCEVWTYFRDDDTPLGRVVELADGVGGSCTPQARGLALGRRVYLLGPAHADECGSLHYDQGLIHGITRTASPSLTWTYALQLVDHRLRKESARCPTPVSAIEISESITQPPEGEGPDTRHFYSPRASETR